MFGQGDDFGVDSREGSSKQYGRNQQYKGGFSQQQQASTPISTQSNGGVLNFNNDSDSDSDDDITQPTNGKTQLIMGNSSRLSGMGSLQSATNASLTNTERPGTSSSQQSSSSVMRSSVIERQREIILNKQKAGLTGMSINNRPGTNYTYGQSSDIDFNKLKTIVNENSSGMYEPGSLGQSSTGLAPLSKMNNIVRFTNGGNSNEQKIIDLDDEDASADEDDILARQKLATKNASSIPIVRLENTAPPPPPPLSETQSKPAPQQSGSAPSNIKEQQDALLKNLYGDSSDESEEEDDDDKQAHERKMLEIANKNGGGQNSIGEVEEEDDEDDEEASLTGADGTANQLAPVVALATVQQPDTPLVNQIAENIEILDMKSFLTKPVPKGMIIQTTIRRDKSGFARFYPKYHVHLSSGLRYLMTGKKRSSNKTSNYLMSMSKTELTKKSAHFLGKVRSNFLGTEFHVYDTGNNPKKCKTIEGVRRELAGVVYESNLLGARGPRKMKVTVPDILPNGEPISIRPMSSKDGIFPMIKQGRNEGLLHFINKPPKWNEQVQAFVLNFSGRVDRPSVKNFQLVNQNNDEQILLQFGRIGDHAFNMDVAYPFSISQAFGICISSFDYKFACE